MVALRNVTKPWTAVRSERNLTADHEIYRRVTQYPCQPSSAGCERRIIAMGLGEAACCRFTSCSRQLHI